MKIRERTAADEEPLLGIAREIHVRDGYPRYLPGGDIRKFLLGHETLGAWVADSGAALTGQVALHPRTGRAAMQLAAAALSQPVERIAAVARLLVRPDARRSGAGRALLRHAAEAAVALGRYPVLDVVVDSAPAIALYEECGWVRAGRVTLTLSPDTSFDEFVYLAPEHLRPQQTA